MIAEITKLDSEIFWRGQLIRDVPKIRLLSWSERKEGGRQQPDIEVKSVIHGTYRVYRNFIGNVFQDTSGKPVKVSRLHTNKLYQVQAPVVPPVGIAFLPPSKLIRYTLNGKELNNSKYIMFSLSADGRVLVQQAKVIAPKVFHKIVNVTDTAEKIAERVERKKSVDSNPANDFLLGDCRIIGQVVSKSNYKVVGYVIGFLNEAGQGEEQPLPLDKVRVMVRERRVRNMTTDFKLTYGSLKELPSFYVD